MLEKPDLPDTKIGACLQAEYGLSVEQIAFLPLGADFNTAVYRVVAGDTAYFFKLRRGAFDESSVTVPGFFSNSGITQIIPPLATTSERLWGSLVPYKTILYPFVTGKDGYQADLADHHWRELGVVLKQIHSTTMPPSMVSQIRREGYSPRERNMVRMVLARIEEEHFDDPIADELAAFMTANSHVVGELVDRAQQLARALQARPPQLIVCHADIHAGNLLIEQSGALYIVDWDEVILAPKERDLMYIGGGLMASGLAPEAEEALFYQGYGDVQLNRSALAYYRYERIVQDIAAYCEQLLSSNEGGDDREQSLRAVKSNFSPGGTIEIAYQSDKSAS